MVNVVVLFVYVMYVGEKMKFSVMLSLVCL